jgi:glycosyltransferase involved in cell wall biosynthesis
MKRIILLNTYYKPCFGGIEGTLLSLSQSAIRKGYTPIIIASNLDFQRNPTLSSHEVIDDIDIYRFKTRRVSGLGYFFSIYNHLVGIVKLFKSLNVSNQDIVIARNHMVCFVAVLYSFFKPLTVYYIPPCIINDFNIQMFKRQQEYQKTNWYLLKLFYLKFVQGFFEYIMQSVALVFSKGNFMPSQMFINQFKVNYPFIPSSKYIKAPFGVDSSRFSPENKNNKLPLVDEGVRSFVFLNSFSPKKGIIIGLEALGLIKELNFHLFLIGDGALKDKIIQKISELGLEKKVTLLGSKLDPENYLSSADYLFYCSLYESFGNTLTEGMASGLPAIAFKHNPPISEVPNEELVFNNVNGYLSETTREAYAEILKKAILLSHEDLLTLKKSTREYAMNNFSWDNYLEKLIAYKK